MWFSAQFNPKLITWQIIVMQSAFYASLAVWIAIWTGIVGAYGMSLGKVFSWSSITFMNASGWATVMGFLFNAIVMSFCLAWVVERAKKCLDFVATMHILHLLVVVIYSGFPSLGWWIVQGLCIGISTILGEYLCMKRELRAIPLQGRTVAV